MLTLLSYIYWLIWAIRKKLYGTGILKVKRLPCPVISVGNITTGGTGKTPAVIALAKLLQGSTEWEQPSNLPPQGSQEPIQHIAILTRGYKRRSKDPILVVSDGNKIISNPEESGDEPYLIASSFRNAPVIVGADRYRSGRYSINNFGTKLFILDDGYQHIKLHRDIDILLIDASNPIGNGHLLPKGILREPLVEISRADCIIISRANEGDREYAASLIRKYNKSSPVFYGGYNAQCFIDLNGNRYGLNHVAGKRLLLFSGIGNPCSFRRTVEDVSGMIKGEIIFPDHHWYTEKDVRKILREAGRLSVDAILFTDKDAVRLKETHLLFEMQNKIDILSLHVEMEIGKEFGEWIIQQVNMLMTEGRRQG